MLKPIKTEPARNRVLAQLRKNIFSGAFPPGYLLNPDHLAQEMSVSRTPIREALQLLAGEGLIDYIPKQGARVKEISVDFLDDYYDTRKWLEGLAIELACQRGIDKEPLQQYLEEESAAYEARDLPQLSACSRRLMEYLYHACGSPRLESYLRQIWSASPRHYSRNDKAREQFVDATFRYHNQLTQALLREDAQEAIRLTERHLDVAKKNYIRYRESESRFADGQMAPKE